MKAKNFDKGAMQGAFSEKTGRNPDCKTTDGYIREKGSRNKLHGAIPREEHLLAFKIFSLLTSYSAAQAGHQLAVFDVVLQLKIEKTGNRVKFLQVKNKKSCFMSPSE